MSFTWGLPGTPARMDCLRECFKPLVFLGWTNYSVPNNGFRPALGPTLETEFRTLTGPPQKTRLRPSFLCGLLTGKEGGVQGRCGIKEWKTDLALLFDHGAIAQPNFAPAAVQ